MVALAGLLLTGAAAGARIDQDAWHQMALVREALSLGQLPFRDPFSYTSTVDRVVHHEWGTGVALYFAGTWFGGAGLAVLRDLLVIGVGAGCVLCARRRGAGHPVLWATLPVAIPFLVLGLATVRAQMFTLLFLAWLLCFLELDRTGRRWWIAPWLVMYLLWANVHAGFVVGAVAYALHVSEQLLARRPVRHLVAVGAAMVVLPALNPYGLDYFFYLWHALRMDRPLVTEWRWIGDLSPALVALYLFSLLLVAYSLLRSRTRNLGGMLFLLASAYAAARHQRHVTLYAVAWACTAPALLQQTPLGALLSRLLAPTRRDVAVGMVLAAALTGGMFLRQRPWDPAVPANPGDGDLLYPVGAVDYLGDAGFRGNLLTPFETGAYVTWKLHPSVRVSLDGRYEVAYDPALLERHLAFYDARDGWEALLTALPTDAALVPHDAPVLEELRTLGGWRGVYRDDAFEVFVRVDGRYASLPVVDRRGERLSGEFP
jgi:hypothetical protein